MVRCLSSNTSDELVGNILALLGAKTDPNCYQRYLNVLEKKGRAKFLHIREGESSNLLAAFYARIWIWNMANH